MWLPRQSHTGTFLIACSEFSPKITLGSSLKVLTEVLPKIPSGLPSHIPLNFFHSCFLLEIPPKISSEFKSTQQACSGYSFNCFSWNFLEFYFIKNSKFFQEWLKEFVQGFLEEQVQGSFRSSCMNYIKNYTRAPFRNLSYCSFRSLLQGFLYFSKEFLSDFHRVRFMNNLQVFFLEFLQKLLVQFTQ